MDIKQPDNRHSTVEVLIQKRRKVGLGISIAGGYDCGSPPRISAIKPGSVADISDCFLVNDVVKSINDFELDQLTQDQIVKMTKGAEFDMRVKLQYEVPETPKGGIKKHAFIHLEPNNESFGITVRGGAIHGMPWPLFICRIRPQSSADRNGCLKTGDRILAINGVQTKDIPCEESMQMLSCYHDGISLFIEYDITDIAAPGRRGTGPFAIEIEKLASERLGASLVAFGDAVNGSKRLIISHIRDGSIADRCGALRVGDLVESINDKNADSMDLLDAMDILDSKDSQCIRLRILSSPENKAKGVNKFVAPVEWSSWA